MEECRIKEDMLSFEPFIPSQWTSYSFKIRFRGNLLKVIMDTEGVTIENQTERDIRLLLDGKLIEINGNGRYESGAKAVGA